MAAMRERTSGRHDELRPRRGAARARCTLVRTPCTHLLYLACDRAQVQGKLQKELAKTATGQQEWQETSGTLSHLQVPRGEAAQRNCNAPLAMAGCTMNSSWGKKGSGGGGRRDALGGLW